MTMTGRPSTPAAVFGFLLLGVLALAAVWGVWRWADAALAPVDTTAWLPAVILLLLAAHWFITAVGRTRVQGQHTLRLQTRRAAAYRKALRDEVAGADLVLWASADVLRLYAQYQTMRQADRAAAPPVELLAAMRRDLGHSSSGALDAQAWRLIVVPSAAPQPTRLETASRDYTRGSFISR